MTERYFQWRFWSEYAIPLAVLAIIVAVYVVRCAVIAFQYKRKCKILRNNGFDVREKPSVFNVKRYEWWSPFFKYTLDDVKVVNMSNVQVVEWLKQNEVIDDAENNCG